MQILVQTQYVAGQCHRPDGNLPRHLAEHITLRLPGEVANRSLANAGIKALLAVKIDGVTHYFVGVLVTGGHDTKVTLEGGAETRIVAAASQFSLFTKADVRAGDEGLIAAVRKNEQPYSLEALVTRADEPLQVLVPVKNTDSI